MSLPLVVAASIVAGPVMGLCLPLRNWFRSNSHVQVLRVVTCNSLQGRADWRLSALIEREQPDVVALQEWPVDQPLPESINGDAWNVVRSAGLVLASRRPIMAGETVTSPIGWKRTLGIRGELQLKTGPVQLCVLHLSTPREGLEAVLAHGWHGLRKSQEVTAMREVEAMAVGKWLGTCTESLVVAGDFNMTPESVIYRSQFGQLQNAFSVAGIGWGGTRVTRYHRARIDHILVSTDWQVVRCKVGIDVGSDHLPVIAEMELR